MTAAALALPGFWICLIFAVACLAASVWLAPRNRV